MILVADAAIVHLLASVDWPLGDRDRRATMPVIGHVTDGGAARTVAVLALVWVVVRRVAEQSERVSTAREQLDARLARGEIDTEEHRERLEASSGHRIED